MTTVPPSPAQGETAGVSERELLDMTMVRLIAAIGTQRVSVDLAKDAVQRLSVLDRDNAALRQQLAELQREKAAAVGLQQGTALVVKQLEQQLADSAHEVERLNAANAAMRGALELARSHIREHDDHVGDCELSQSDGDAPCSCDYGFTLTQIDAALAPTSQPSRCPTCGGAKALFEPHEPGSTHKIIDCPDCAQPERQGAKCDHMGCMIKTHTGATTGDCTRCGETFVLPQLPKSSPPPTAGPDGPSDIVAGLHEILPEFTSDEDGRLCIEWYGGKASVLTVTIDDAKIWFSAATAPGITSSAVWELGDPLPQPFIGAYRAIAALKGAK